MRAESALSRLKDGELCIVTTKCQEREMRWSVSNWCFYYTSAGTPIVCPFNDIVEWRPSECGEA